MDDADGGKGSVKRRDVIVFGVGAAEMEITFVVDHEGRHSARDRVVGELFKTGIPETADGMIARNLLFEVGCLREALKG